MKTFHVQWEIEVDAECAEDAARAALAIHRDHDSLATVFQVAEFTDNPMDFHQETIDVSAEPVSQEG